MENVELTKESAIQLSLLSAAFSELIYRFIGLEQHEQVVISQMLNMVCKLPLQDKIEDEKYLEIDKAATEILEIMYPGVKELFAEMDHIEDEDIKAFSANMIDE